MANTLLDLLKHVTEYSRQLTGFRLDDSDDSEGLKFTCSFSGVQTQELFARNLVKISYSETAVNIQLLAKIIILHILHSPYI